MSNGIFGIGLSALNAAQLGLATTAHNIANAATPAYARQGLVQANAEPQFTGAGYLGQGVRVLEVRRIYSQFIAQQLLEAQSRSAYCESYRNRVGELENLLGSSSAGLAPALEGFFDSVHALAADAGSTVARRQLLAAGQALVARFHALDGRMRELGTQLEREIAARVANANGLAREIAALNERIVALGASGRAPNDLLDRREALVRELANEIGVSALRHEGGGLDLFLASGQPLVLAHRAFELRLQPDPYDGARSEIVLATPGAAVRLPAQAFSGGALGAAVAFGAGALESARAELGRIASGLALAFNAQHHLGQDLSGALGADFFSLAPVPVLAKAGNAGDAQIAASLQDAAELVASDYRLSYDGARYALVRLADGARWEFASLPATVDGMAITLAAGAPAAGDEFTIRPLRETVIGLALSDPARIAAAVPIRTASAAANTGRASVSAGSVLGPPLDPNLLAPVTISFTSPTTYDVTGIGTGDPTGLIYTPGADIRYNGWVVQIRGEPAAGDVFTVSPNTGATGDNRNALRLGELAGRGLLDRGHTRLQSAYAGLVGALGTQGREATVMSQAQQALTSELVRAEQTISGVNLDEEAAHLIRYQQAYQAAARVIEVAERMFATLLELGR
jgi:flagellar hook-associated protein 1 FlgK